MPKRKNPLAINLNLLKPQSNPEKILVKLISWLLSSGRYIFIFVEALVLIAFIARFKLDADLAAKKEAIEEQIPYIESLASYEILIRNTQLQLATIDSITKNSPNWSGILKKIADQVPLSVKINSIRMEKNANSTNLHITGQTQINSDISSFVTGLKADPSFTNTNVASLSLEENVIKFTIDTSAKMAGLPEKNL